jgi:hypothetical protein
MSTNCTMMDSQEHHRKPQITNPLMEVPTDHQLPMMSRLRIRGIAHRLTVRKILVQGERSSLREITIIFLLLVNLEGFNIEHCDVMDKCTIDVYRTIWRFFSFPRLLLSWFDTNECCGIWIG